VFFTCKKAGREQPAEHGNKKRSHRIRRCQRVGFA
jgi:hypothetical protein